MIRWIFILAATLAVTSCSTPKTIEVPVEVTRVVYKEATRQIVHVETQIVVVTATPLPVTPTDEPPAEPSNTPEPTALPEPTVAPLPTTAAPLEPGETVEGTIIRTIRIYDIPNEQEGHMVVNASPGIVIDVLYRGGQWYQVRALSTDNEVVTGWVYRDWISIAPEDAVRLQPYPDALPVIVTKITQSRSNGYEYWSGTVLNIGAKTAYDVQVEITLNGQVGDTETVAAHGTAFVATRNLKPGQTAKFTVRTTWVSSEGVFYSHKVLWTAK